MPFHYYCHHLDIFHAPFLAMLFSRAIFSIDYNLAAVIGTGDKLAADDSNK